MYKLFLILLFSTSAVAQTWDTLPAINTCTARSESSLAVIKNKIYLLGSRGIRPVDAYDVNARTWTPMQSPPMELHHFQAAVYANEIWVLGAFTKNYPHELPVDHIYIFNPDKNAWRQGPAIPSNRLRGSAGVVNYKGKLYMVGGEIDGHWDGHVAWLDEYNPKTNTWKILPDAPHARDHVQVDVNQDKLYMIAGRRTSTSTNNVLGLKEPTVDVYDFKTKTWTTLPASSNIPTLRADASVVAYKDLMICMGGESDTQVPGHSEVEALNVKTLKWTALPKLHQGRHGTGAVRIKNKIYFIAGASNRGGGPETGNGEVLTFPN
jgi:N-acetylneuraminic acid mutarotase